MTISTAHHARLLLAILNRRWDESRRLSVERLDPERFVALCLRCDVAGWVHALLGRENLLELIGDEVADRLEAIRSKMQRDNLLLLARAEQALDLLLAAGVTPVALKGLDVLGRLYSRLDERSLDDVDLLVQAGDLRPALAALESGGWKLPSPSSVAHYIRSSHHLPLRSPGPVPVDFEIHWGLAQETRFRVDAEALFERAVTLEVGGRRVLRLEDHDLVAHLLLHHFTHYFDWRLKWAVDLAAISSDPDFHWRQVADRIHSWDAVVACGMSLDHLAKLFPTWIPDEMSRRVRVPRWRRALVAPLRSRHPLELFRGTRQRRMQLLLAALLIEHPHRLPAWLWHRWRRDRRPGSHPLERLAAERAATDPAKPDSVGATPET